MPELNGQLQKRIDSDNQEQCAKKEHHSCETMQKSLSGFITEMIGDQCQYHDSYDVGSEGDGDDQNSQRNVSKQGIVPNDIQVQQAQSLECKKGVQASTGVCD